MTPTKKIYFPVPIWEGIARRVTEIVLSLIMTHNNVKDGLCGGHFYFATAGLLCNATGN